MAKILNQKKYFNKDQKKLYITKITVEFLKIGIIKNTHLL